MFASDFSGLAIANLFFLGACFAGGTLLVGLSYFLYTRCIDRHLPTGWRNFRYWPHVLGACTVSMIITTFLFDWFTQRIELGVFCLAGSLIGLFISIIAHRNCMGIVRYLIIAQIIFFFVVFTIGCYTIAMDRF